MTFWINDITELTKSTQIIPSSTFPFDENLNTITRLVLAVWVVLYAMEYESHLVFLLNSLLAVVLIYFARSKGVVERYGDTVNFDPPQEFFSNRTRDLIGEQNTKLLENTPVIMPRAYDTDYWCRDGYTPFYLNADRPFNASSGGFMETHMDNNFEYTMPDTPDPFGADSDNVRRSRRTLANPPSAPTTYTRYIHSGMGTNEPSSQSSYTSPVYEPSYTFSHPPQQTPLSHPPQQIHPTFRMMNAAHSCQPELSVEGPHIGNVFDPRSGGYGSDGRSYIHPVTGQVRFYYDDIDAVRTPNYISRSNIDHLDCAPKYGTYKENVPNLREMKSIASTDFINQTNLARRVFQDRYVDKFNRSTGGQRRSAYIHTY